MTVVQMNKNSNEQ